MGICLIVASAISKQSLGAVSRRCDSLFNYTYRGFDDHHLLSSDYHVDGRFDKIKGAEKDIIGGEMKKCRECGHQVSEQAMLCPGCGTPYPARKNWNGWGFEYKIKDFISWAGHYCTFPLNIGPTGFQSLQRELSQSVNLAWD